MHVRSTISRTPAGLLSLARDNARRRPGLLCAVGEDARRATLLRGGRAPSSRLGMLLTVIRLMWGGDDFAGVVLYRLRTSLLRARVPLLPRLLDRTCAVLFGLRIGDLVAVGEGLYVPHGNIVIDGITVIGRRAVITPWVCIGLKEGNFVGPTIGDGVFIGAGASVLGPIHVGDRARIAAGAVVVSDVPAGATVAGVPARVVERSGGEGEL
jgi:serine O-acetyltransferase